jgi:hypothetical protein
MTKKLLAGEVDLGTPLEGVGTIGTGDPVTTIASIISTAIGLMTVIAGVYFIFNIITSAVSIISSAGDKGNLESARTKMTHSMIGLVVTISAMFIVGMLTTVLGIPNFLNFAGRITDISTP